MQNKKISLLDQVSQFENIYGAFLDCSRGKKSKLGFQNFLFAYGEKLKALENELLSTKNYRWSKYQEFFVFDPKKRLVMAAPFKDRIVHTAIHRVLFPVIDPTLGCRTYACRFGLGNLNATKRLHLQLKNMGKNRYCVKLDVKKYFESIPHEIFFEKLSSQLIDTSLDSLIKGLLASHPVYNKKSKGIPIGNLTSQLFANFYLSELDQLGCQLLGLNFYDDQFETESFYIRYMDDIVVLSRSKHKAIKTATAILNYAKENLLLDIPRNKFMTLACDPVPFLGFVLSENNYSVLSRNEQRFSKKLKRANKNKINLAGKAQMIQSFESWKGLYL